jgi:hypothetical protein
MRHIVCHFTLRGGPVFDSMDGDDADGFALHFTLAGNVALSRLHTVFGDLVRAARIDWIRPRRHFWEVDLDGAREAFSDILEASWIHGCVSVEPEMINRQLPTLGAPHFDTSVILSFPRVEIQLSQRSRIFLSHRGANKPLVDRFHHVLKELGFDPWLDREDIVAGDALHRELLAGMQASCAAVFFITPEFRDETYLAYEINLAMAEQTARSDRFRIISLALADTTGARGRVPLILQSLVYMKPDSELEALREILRALPIVVGQSTWRV